ncbi:type III-B CRISPR module RAMP protein Cmr6 [Thiorhodospira sibirica]|uniref:type III-B CRISPR module RAMP protein Cmr6 n=1 Tax=Thiorhodospira sibirica TaxID=154347 RepID=UPI00022C5880|nr:type III-B CRISPR module RAMP protein Cmr6 [Thiorhodospira sibirica]
MLPLYQGHTIPSGEQASRGRAQSKAHPGLWFERFFNTYDDQYVVHEEAKVQFLKGLKSMNGQDGQCGEKHRLEYALLRQRALTQACHGKMLFRRAAWNFVTGLGHPHPVENALLFHPTLAVPYLPGSSVKGMVRAWIEQNLQNPQAALLRLFGSEDKDPNLSTVDFTTGEIIFFDALPVQPVKLVVDTMTPHMGDWYEKGGSVQTHGAKCVPADWHDPVPVPFLAVSDVLMQFSFAPRLQQDDSHDVLALVEYALDQALSTLGAGAKTAAGYGAFLPPTDRQQRELDQVLQEQDAIQVAQQEQAEEQGLSEQALRIKTLKKQSELPQNQQPQSNGDYCRELHQAVSEANAWPDAEKRELAAFAREFFKKYTSKNKQKEYLPAVRELEGGQG